MRPVRTVSLNCLAVNIIQPVGVERFVKNVVGRIKLGDIRVDCYTRKAVRKFDQIFDSTFTKNNTRTRLKRLPASSTVSRIFVEMFVLPFFTCVDDVVLSINNFGPLWGKPGQLRILVIHDVWFMSPNYEGGRLHKWLFKILLSLQILTSSKILTVSDFSRREISRFFNFPISRIQVVSNCMGKDIAVSTCTESSNRLLLIGSERKNKNVMRSIEGYCKFRNSNPGSHTRLVLVGTYSASFFKSIKNLFPEHMPHIELAGYIEDVELEKEYRECVGVIFLSLYEGFGLPAIEGLLFGKPVLVSRNTACAEILEDFAVTVDATDVGEIAKGIGNLIESKVDVLSSDFRKFQNRYMHCEEPANALTSILNCVDK